METRHLSRIKTIELPGEPLVKFDIGWVDDKTRTYYVADRSNARLAAVDVDRAEYSHSLGAGLFTGVPAVGGATAGPNGVVVLADLQQAWAGDGDSTVKIIDCRSRQLLDVVHTQGEHRVDELAYDDEDGIVLVANDQEKVPFVTLISTDPGHEVLGKVEFPQATNGLHQPVWDPGTKRFFVPVTEVGGEKAAGEIAAIDPGSMQVVASYAVRECQPAGLTVGPAGELCVGCSKNAVAAGFAPRSLILDLGSGDLLARVDEVGGSDEVWYNPGDSRYYLAASGMNGGPVLGVIDARTRTWVENVPTAVDAHSVAADARTNRVFVPVPPDVDTPNGGVAVFEMDGSSRRD
ncbi:MAG: cytochrome C nitrite reductase [Candidatus Dormiibacterota bacterium]